MTPSQIRECIKEIKDSIDIISKSKYYKTHESNNIVSSSSLLLSQQKHITFDELDKYFINPLPLSYRNSKPLMDLVDPITDDLKHAYYNEKDISNNNVNNKFENGNSKDDKTFSNHEANNGIISLASTMAAVISSSSSNPYSHVVPSDMENGDYPPSSVSEGSLASTNNADSPRSLSDMMEEDKPVIVKQQQQQGRSLRSSGTLLNETKETNTNKYSNTNQPDDLNMDDDVSTDQGDNEPPKKRSRRITRSSATLVEQQKDNESGIEHQKLLHNEGHNNDDNREGDEEDGIEQRERMDTVSSVSSQSESEVAAVDDESLPAATANNAPSDVVTNSRKRSVLTRAESSASSQSTVEKEKAKIQGSPLSTATATNDNEISLRTRSSRKSTANQKPQNEQSNSNVTSTTTSNTKPLPASQATPSLKSIAKFPVSSPPQLSESSTPRKGQKSSVQTAPTEKPKEEAEDGVSTRRSKSKQVQKKPIAEEQETNKNDISTPATTEADNAPSEAIPTTAKSPARLTRLSSQKSNESNPLSSPKTTSTPSTSPMPAINQSSSLTTTISASSTTATNNEESSARRTRSARKR